MDITEKEVEQMMTMVKKAVECFKCGSKPVVERNERLRKYIVRCLNCKEEYFASTLLEAACSRWNETMRWMNNANEVYEHNKATMARIAKGDVKRLPDIYEFVGVERPK